MGGPAGSNAVKSPFPLRIAPMLTGSLVAIATPMHEGGALDLPALGRLVEFHLANGTAGIVIVGTTGESPTVDHDEHCLLIRTAVELVAKRVPVIAGTGSNSTAEAIEYTAYAKSVGADMALSVVPYYNKPTQEGLYRHFRTIAEKVDLPMLLYNVPGRTVADLGNDTVLKLAQVPGIVGLKDATVRPRAPPRPHPAPARRQGLRAVLGQRRHGAAATSCWAATASSRSPRTSPRG